VSPASAEVVPALFRGLVDDAGLFPPEALPMPAAIARHRADTAAGSAVLTGRFLCPAGRLDDLLEELGRPGATQTPGRAAPDGTAFPALDSTPAETLPLALISPLAPDMLPEALARVAGDDRVALGGVEGPLGDLAGLAALPAGMPCFVELPVTGEWRDALPMLASTGLSGKVRCGGTRPELFPSPEQLGGFVHACAQLGVPFKATAGLHHALPYRDPATGFTHHGFLNLLLAASRAIAGAAAGDVIAALSMTHADALVGEATALTPDHAAAARQLFVAYGSCSTADPVDDLRTLGLVSGPATVPV